MLNRKTAVFLFVLIQRLHLGAPQRFFPHPPYGQFRGPVFSFPHGENHDGEYASRGFEDDFSIPENDYMNEPGPGEGSCPAFNQAFNSDPHNDQDETLHNYGHQEQCQPPPQFFAGKSGFPGSHPFGHAHGHPFRQAGPFPFPFPQPYPFMVPFPSPHAFWFPHPNRPPGPFGYGQSYRTAWPDEKVERNRNRSATAEEDDLRDAHKSDKKGENSGQVVEKCSEVMVSNNTQSADMYRILGVIQRQLRNLHGFKEPQSKFGLHLRKALSSVSDLLKELDMEDDIVQHKTDFI